VQVPPDGKPIVLMHDRQTAGGYPMVAQVITADLPTVAQFKPSDEIGFEEVSIDDAQKALAERSILLDGLREGERRASSRP
jgi:antagonist of KipI